MARFGPPRGSIDWQRWREDFSRLSRRFLPTRPWVQRPLVPCCSFCRKERPRVRRLIEGPHRLRICDECIARCQAILDEPPKEDRAS